MFNIFALLVAVIALIIARKTFNQITALRARLDGIEAIVREAPTSASLGALGASEPTPAAASPETAAEQPAMASEPRAVLQASDSRNDMPGITAATPPPAAP